MLPAPPLKYSRDILGDMAVRLDNMDIQMEYSWRRGDWDTFGKLCDKEWREVTRDS